MYHGPTKEISSTWPCGRPRFHSIQYQFRHLLPTISMSNSALLNGRSWEYPLPGPDWQGEIAPIVRPLILRYRSEVHRPPLRRPRWSPLPGKCRSHGADADSRSPDRSSVHRPLAGILLVGLPNAARHYRAWSDHWPVIAYASTHVQMALNSPRAARRRPERMPGRPQSVRPPTSRSTPGGSAGLGHHGGAAPGGLHRTDPRAPAPSSACLPSRVGSRAVVGNRPVASPPSTRLPARPRPVWVDAGHPG